MSSEELNDWFWNKFNTCYPIINDKFPNWIFWIYDEKFKRKLKLCKISNESVSIPKSNKIEGLCLFAQNQTTHNFYVNNSEIWYFFEDNLTTDKPGFINYYILDEIHSILDKSKKFQLNEYSVINKLPGNVIPDEMGEMEVKEHFHVYTSYFYLQFQYLHTSNKKYYE